MKHINRDYSENPYIDPKNTHPSITLDVAIPHTWESVSYSNDVSPSFTIKNLQIFICDEETKKLEQLDTKYSVMYQDDYGCTYDSLLNTDDWSEVLLFVQLHKFEEYAYRKENLNMEHDIVNGMSLEDFLKKYGKEYEDTYNKVIKICEEDV